MRTATLWPTAVEFVEAVQRNSQAFPERDLCCGTPVVNKRNFEPIYVSGGFATVCFIECQKSKYAVNQVFCQF